MRSTPVEAIVLKVHDYREADIIATLFTRELGKIQGVAPHARKSRKRFGGALDFFSRLSLSVRFREGLSRIDEADIVSLFPRIREDITGVAYATYACELTDLFLPDGMPNHRHYRLLCAFLERLDTVPPACEDLRFFEINLLNILGYRPELGHCSVCSTPLDGRTSVTFHPSSHVITCTGCAGAGTAVAPTVPSLLLASLKTSRFGSIPFSPQELNDSGIILENLVISHAGREPKSLRFLRKMT